MSVSIERFDSAASGDFGFVLRTAEPHTECMNGHLLRLAGTTSFYSHGLNLHATCCDLCAELHLDRYAWLPVDHTTARRADEPEDPRSGIEFVAYPPPIPAGVGQIRLHIEHAPVAHVQLQMCGVDQRGVIAHVEVKDSYRRRRIATMLVACALARGPKFHWSTVRTVDTVQTRALRASLATTYRLEPGQPHYCSHMAYANGHLG